MSKICPSCGIVHNQKHYKLMCDKCGTHDYKMRHPEVGRALHLSKRPAELVRMRLNHEKNKERDNLTMQRWYALNRAKKIAQSVAYEKYRMATDVNFRIKKSCAQRIRYILRKYLIKKENSSSELTGCTAEHLAKHLESQFQEGMCWENYGLWEIDHIKPCSKHKLQNKEELFACFNWRNLQPLWEIDNIRKYNHYVENK